MERALFIPDIDRLPGKGQSYDRLYLGSEFCSWRLPGVRELAEALAAATRRGMGFSLVTPFLDEPGLTRTLALVRTLPDDPAIEIVANDLGLIEALRAKGWRRTVVAGRLLTRQRRGPGFQSFGDVLPEAAAALRSSALDSPAFVGLLGLEYGVTRFELDDIVQGASVPSLPAGVSLSLYRPYLLVTATRNCPWVFDGRTWDRGHGCARPCRGQVLRLVTAASSEGGMDRAEGWREAGAPGGAQRFASTDGGVQRQDPAAGTVHERAAGTPLALGGCAQFLEHRSEAPPPAGVDRIVWQPEIPA